MNFDTGHLVLEIMTGAIGTGYFIYGKKRQRWVALGAGMGLMILPMLIDNLLGATLICIVLCALPWFIRE